MKSIIKQQDNTQNSEYPCLKIYDDPNYAEFHRVVLFTSRNYGTCVCAIGRDAVLGDTCAWLEEEFEPFNGVVELSN